ncbi:MAG: hypothetical protein ACTHNZ_10745 [Trinickia sp.]|uniref:hypothetical protein n=1 Tax=Trinickia sp. TaxID=2571163 RepID=UPI003F7CE3EA
MIDKLRSHERFVDWLGRSIGEFVVVRLPRALLIPSLICASVVKLITYVSDDVGRDDKGSRVVASYAVGIVRCEIVELEGQVRIGLLDRFRP